MNESEKYFIRGFGLVVAELIRTHDQPTLARDIMSGAGYELKDFENAMVDGYDLNVLKKELK